MITDQTLRDEAALVCAESELGRGVFYYSVPGIAFATPVAPETMTEVLGGWMDFSPILQNAFLQTGGEICVARTGRDASPENAYKKLHQDDLFGRTYLDHAGAAYLQDFNKIVIAEYILASAHEPSPLNALSSSTLARHMWYAQASEEIAYAVRHEVCHALSEIGGCNGSAVPVYRRAGFQKAYLADVRGMGEIDEGRKKGYGYFLPCEKTVPSLMRALQETFAELGAEARGGCLRGASMVRDWPRCSSYVCRYLDQFETWAKAAFSQDAGPRSGFICDRSEKAPLQRPQLSSSLNRPPCFQPHG